MDRWLIIARWRLLFVFGFCQDAHHFISFIQTIFMALQYGSGNRTLNSKAHRQAMSCFMSTKFKPCGLNLRDWRSCDICSLVSVFIFPKACFTSYISTTYACLMQSLKQSNVHHI